MDDEKIISGIPKYSRDIRKQLMEIFNGRCYYCGREVLEIPFKKGQKKPRNAATIDHIIPVCRGGEDKIDNMVLACHACNNEKGNMSLKNFKKKKQKS